MKKNREVDRLMRENDNEHNRLICQGYGVEMLIPDSKLPEGLAHLALEIERGHYKSVRILPARVALRGDVLPKKDSHLVYAILSNKHGYRKRIKSGLPVARPPIQMETRSGFIEYLDRPI